MKKEITAKELEIANNSIRNLQAFLKERLDKAKSASEKNPGNTKLLTRFTNLNNEYNIFNSILTLLIQLWQENEVLKNALVEMTDTGFDDILWDKPFTPPSEVN